MDKDKVLGLVNKLKKMGSSHTATINAFIGFDGFVDEVVHVVKKRIDTTHYKREETLADYGNRIAKTAGYSSNVEIVSVSKKLGGNGPILANALINCGVKINYAGAVGFPNINPVFLEMAEKCETVTPLSDPAMTDAVEFNDGKIIRCKLSAFNSLNFETIKQEMGLDKLASLMDVCDLLCFVNWALVPFSGQIWQSILDEVVPKLKVETKNKILFFDLADPASRTQADLKKALETITQFGKHYKVVLGLNLSEAVQVASVWGSQIKKNERNLELLCNVIAKAMNIDTVIIHPAKRACCVSLSEYYVQEGPYCKAPKLTTGAGDNFNAGFILGKALDLNLDECLILGVASSGYYVRNAKSGTLSDIISFLKRVSEDKLE